MRDQALKWLLGAAAAAALLGVGTARAADLSDEDCKGCHGEQGITRAGGKSVRVDLAAFAGTKHADVGCSTCHEGISKGHPDDLAKVPKAACKGCHEQVAAEYGATKHAGAAGCTDCHDPHDARGPASVTAARMNAPCAACHEREPLARKHAGWLPQTSLHLASISCIGCHTGSKEFSLTLTVEHRAPPGQAVPLGRQELDALAPAGKTAATLVDTDGDGSVSLAELRRFNLDNRGRDASLGATIVPEHVTHTWQVLANRRDCTFCHAAGPSARQTGFLVVPEPDGRTIKRLPVEGGALVDLLYGTPDFYMIGANETRNPIMSLLAGLIVLAGAGVVALHGFFRALTIRSRQAHAAGESKP